jgi:hypothetical protein
MKINITLTSNVQETSLFLGIILNTRVIWKSMWNVISFVVAYLIFNSQDTARLLHDSATENMCMSFSPFAGNWYVCFL